MKADKAIRLVKHIPGLAVQFDQQAPVVPILNGGLNDDNHGWSLETATKLPNPNGYSYAVAVWDDTIDIAGLAANDISLINQGGAIARAASPYTLMGEDASVQQLTLVSVNPIEVSYTNWPYATSPAVEGNLQDYFLATTQEFVKAADSTYIFTKSGEHNFGTGGIAQATKLYVKSIVTIYQKGNTANTGVVYVPPAVVALGGVTAELDAVQMAAAIYRANDQE